MKYEIEIFDKGNDSREPIYVVSTKTFMKDINGIEFEITPQKEYLREGQLKKLIETSEKNVIIYKEKLEAIIAKKNE